MKKFSAKIKVILCAVVCVCLFITFTCMALADGEQTNDTEDTRSVLKVWQIDSFEGGKGSRADFLQSIGNDFAESGNGYVSVTSLSSEAARLNLSKGNVPDIISYGAGIYGIESYITGYTQWCRGGYCLLTVEGDFSDATAENTVVNSGKENFTAAALMLGGLNGAEQQTPTSAYLKLVNGNCKYLFGTQRDIYRLKTRGVNFTVKPVTAFNDLYQNISVTTACKDKNEANKFIDYLLSRRAEVTRLGMISDGAVYEDEMREMVSVEFDYKITSPFSEETRNRLLNIISSGDINTLKSFFN